MSQRGGPAPITSLLNQLLRIDRFQYQYTRRRACVWHHLIVWWGRVDINDIRSPLPRRSRINLEITVPSHMLENVYRSGLLHPIYSSTNDSDAYKGGLPSNKHLRTSGFACRCEAYFLVIQLSERILQLEAIRRYMKSISSGIK